VQIIEEAQRLLKPGGALAIMEMNPYSSSLQRMVNNVFAFTAVSFCLLLQRADHLTWIIVELMCLDV
jgi:ubiquinone/menaquinone biosynthesis C-methylase UbiE